jgi:hypothetical protein
MSGAKSRWGACAVVCAASALMAFAGVSKLLSGPGTSGVALMDEVCIRRSTAVGELLLACWLASGWKHSIARLSVGLAFLSFCGVATWMTLRGATTCGCFGDLEVAPFWMVAVDAAIAGLLLLSPRTAWQPSDCRRWINAMVLSIVAGGAVSLSSNQPQSVVWLRPAEWNGAELPILRDIVGASDLGEGEWTLVFYRPGCHECLARAEHYRELAEGARTLFVTMPPTPQVDNFRDKVGAGEFATLNNRQLWFMETPAVVKIADGVVL